MNLSNSELDQLFENVRKEKPVATFEETQRTFIAATIASAGGVLATKSLLKLFTFKQWIIMISVLSAATVGTLLVTLTASTEKASSSLSENEVNSNNKKEIIQSDAVIAENAAERTAIIKLDEAHPEMQIVTQKGKPPIMVRAYLLDDGTYHFEYFITQETSEEDLKKLQAEAKAAGFELKYEPTFESDKLMRLNLQIVQIKENGQRQNIQISDIDLKESSNYKVAWNVDDNGTATSIACGEEFRLKEADQREIEELMESLRMEELVAEMEQLEMDELTAELKQLQEELGEELAHIDLAREMQIAGLEELAEVEELVAQLRVEEIMESFDEEAMVEMREGMEEAFAEMEREQEKMRKEFENMCEQHKGHADCCQKGHEKMLNELESDGLINDKAKRTKMTASRGKIEVNGKEIPKDLRRKYEQLIEELFEVDMKQKDLKWQWVHVCD
ncbi:MAG: hypothetical protein NXI10_11630 [bacterium]|nr:hypothetical protein [bacterium]